MAKFGVQVRRVWLSAAMREALDQYVTDEKKLTPGQLRMRGAWFWLAYLKVVKVKTFELPLWELAANEVNTVRCVGFRLEEQQGSGDRVQGTGERRADECLRCGEPGAELRLSDSAGPYCRACHDYYVGGGDHGCTYALLVQGSAGEIREIAGLLDALALQVAGAEGTFADYYRIDAVDVDLGARLGALEAAGLVADVCKVHVKDMEVKLGVIGSAVIKTDDYGGVKKVLAEVGEKVRAIEVQLKHPEKTWVTLGADGSVKVQSRAMGTDFDFEDLVVREAVAGAVLVPAETPRLELPDEPEQALKVLRTAALLDQRAEEARLVLGKLYEETIEPIRKAIRGYMERHGYDAVKAALHVNGDLIAHGDQLAPQYLAAAVKDVLMEETPATDKKPRTKAKAELAKAAG